jgi:hypothetical protein
LLPLRIGEWTASGRIIEFLGASLKASTREAQRKERLALFKEADLPLVRNGRKKSD